jgi:hypothetical protein
METEGRRKGTEETNHNVGPVEDQRKEKREAAEVHVSLGVEFSSLHFHSLGAYDGGPAR